MECVDWRVVASQKADCKKGRFCLIVEIIVIISIHFVARDLPVP